MAAGIVYHNITTSSGVTFSIACWVPDTTAPDVGAIPVSTLLDTAANPVTFNANQTADYAKSTGAAPVMLPEDQLIAVKASTVTNGTSKTRIVSAASTNATSVKTSAGKIMSVRLFNVAAYDVFFKFYDKASAPTVGTDTPSWTIPIKSGTGYSEHFFLGDDFTTGIAYAITKLIADSDTTAVVAGDVTGKMHWI